MKRPGPFQAMFDLPIGSEISIPPDPGEKAEAALSRIKSRASKYRPRGRSYRVTLAGDLVIVRRTAFNANKKLSDWEAMKAGEVRVLDENPTAVSIKAATNRVAYLNSKRSTTNPKRRAGAWTAYLDAGRLVAQCMIDSSGSSVFDAQRSKVPPPLTPQEQAAQSAAQCRGIAGFQRREARGANPAMAKILLYIAKKFDERALEHDEQAGRAEILEKSEK